jgi:xylose isomerase
MDAFARGLEIAHAIIEDGRLDAFVEERYQEWESAFGKKVFKGVKTLNDLEDHVMRHGEPARKSGRQEFLENLINEFVL